LLQSQAGLGGTARLIQPDGEPYEIRLEGHSTLVQRIAPGNYVLEIRQAGKEPRTLPVRIVEGETTTVPIDPSSTGAREQ